MKGLHRILIAVILFGNLNLLADSTFVSKLSFKLKSVIHSDTLLDELWLFTTTSDSSNSRKNLSEKDWVHINSFLSEEDIKKTNFKGRGWFRTTFFADSDQVGKCFVQQFYMAGSCRVYVNGKFISEIGEYGGGDDERSDGKNEPVYFSPVFGLNVIAVEFENTLYEHTYADQGNLRGGFTSKIEPVGEFHWNEKNAFIQTAILGLGFFFLFASFGLIHFLLFLFYRERKSNLVFSIFCFLLSYYFISIFITKYVISNPETQKGFIFSFYLSFPFLFISLISVFYSFFYQKIPKQFYFITAMALITSICLFSEYTIGAVLLTLLIVIVLFEVLRIMIMANRKKMKGARIITIGFLSFISFVSFLLAQIFLRDGKLVYGSNEFAGVILVILFLLTILSIPLSMSIFLAWDFSQTNKSLSEKLVEVEELSVKTIEQEKEKQKMLAEQNEVLEVQVEERTKEINQQKKVIEEKNKDITDSINYAQRIQKSILPTDQEIKDIFKESFVLFKPRDIVSGDFYQFKKNGDLKYAILADCTGHGVPGALMSMVGSNLLKQIILERGTKEPNKILSELHKEVRSTLRQTGGVQSHDGMDAAILLLHKKKIFIASANRPVYIVKEGILTELKPDKRSIGGSQASDEIEFNLNEVDVETGMMVYLFSDGYADQFGGEAGKKFKVKNLSNLLLSIHTNALLDQKNILNAAFDEWKKHLEQVDDVSLIGIRF